MLNVSFLFLSAPNLNTNLIPHCMGINDTGILQTFTGRETRVFTGLITIMIFSFDAEMNRKAADETMQDIPDSAKKC